MVNIENLFKHNIFFTPFDEHIADYISIRDFTINVVYVSNKIYNDKKLGIRDVDGLIDKIDLFFYYLASKYQEKNEGSNYNDAFFSVCVSFGDFSNISNSFVIVNNFAVSKRVNKDIFLEKSNKGTQICPELNDIYSKPFQISISLRVDFYQEIEFTEFQEYETNEDDNEVEHKSEDEEPLKPLKSFKTDHCVICMKKPPNILFYNCMHICTFSNCEENTLNCCPYCRAIVIETICI